MNSFQKSAITAAIAAMSAASAALSAALDAGGESTDAATPGPAPASSGKARGSRNAGQSESNNSSQTPSGAAGSDTGTGSQAMTKEQQEAKYGELKAAVIALAEKSEAKVATVLKEAFGVEHAKFIKPENYDSAIKVFKDTLAEYNRKEGFA